MEEGREKQPAEKQRAESTDSISCSAAGPGDGQQSLFNFNKSQEVNLHTTLMRQHRRHGGAAAGTSAEAERFTGQTERPPCRDGQKDEGRYRNMKTI